jgi:Bacterial Ig-like domain (group 1)
MQKGMRKAMNKTRGSMMLGRGDEMRREDTLMRSLKFLAIGAVAMLLSACGDNTLQGADPGGTIPTDPAAVATIVVSSSTASIASDGSQTADITATVLDANNATLPNVAVTFSVDTGIIAVTLGTTDSTGIATGTLSTGGDATLRTISISASAAGSGGTVTGVATVDVVNSSAGAVLATVVLAASSNQIPSDGSDAVELTAFTRDQNNNFLEGINVTFSVDTGGIAVTQGTTDIAGSATAEANTAGDPTNRTVTVTATATDPNDGTSLTDTLTLQVAGSTLAINGASAIVSGDTSTYTVALVDAGGSGIAGEVVALSSANGNTLSGPSVTTDSTGQAQFTVTGAAGGIDTLTGTALGLTATKTLSVSTDSFVITVTDTAADGVDIGLGDTETVTATWLIGGAPQVGQTINFSTTRGTLGAASDVTDGAGQASVTIDSTTAGAATVRAITASTGLDTQSTLQFVADPADADDLVLSADPFVVGPNEQATITAILSDASGNKIANADVSFVLTDSTGGTISSGLETTDSLGRALITYTASDLASNADDVLITATSVAVPAVADSVTLTVSRQARELVLGTGDDLSEPTTSQYTKDWVVQVSNTSGAAVEGATVTLAVRSVQYYKGEWFFDATSSTWFQVVSVGSQDLYDDAECDLDNTTAGTNSGPDGIPDDCDDTDGDNNLGPGNGFLDAETFCIDEDANRNFVLDLVPVSEDYNGNGSWEAGAVATVSPQTVVTNASGFAFFELTYPQEYGAWLTVELVASTNVQGTESQQTRVFALEILADDIGSDNPPPGIDSPFGIGVDLVTETGIATDNQCSNPD